MASLNKCCFIGNLTKEVEVRTTPNQIKVVNFSIAVNEKFTDAAGQKKESTEFVKIVAWRHLADIAEKYLRKGSQIYVEGKFKTRSWDDQSGQKRYTTEVVVDNFQMLGGRQDGQRLDSSSNQLPPETPELPY